MWKNIYFFITNYKSINCRNKEVFSYYLGVHFHHLSLSYILPTIDFHLHSNWNFSLFRKSLKNPRDQLCIFFRLCRHYFGLFLNSTTSIRKFFSQILHSENVVIFITKGQVRSEINREALVGFFVRWRLGTRRKA